MSYDANSQFASDRETLAGERWSTPQRTVKVCIECGGLATESLSGAPYCWDHHREQTAVLMGIMADQVAAERAGK